MTWHDSLNVFYDIYSRLLVLSAARGFGARFFWLETTKVKACMQHREIEIWKEFNISSWPSGQIHKVMFTDIQIITKFVININQIYEVLFL